MKSIFTFITTTVLFFAVSSIIAQPVKTLVKSFNLQGNTSVALDLKGEVDVQNWNQDILQIQIEIYNEQFNGRVVKALIAAGRYNLKGDEKDGVYIINAPALEKMVKIRGVELKDKVVYKVFAPSKVHIRLDNQLESSISEVRPTNGTP